MSKKVQHLGGLVVAIVALFFVANAWAHGVVGVPAAVPGVEVSDVTKTALLGDGCFWCTEADLEKVKGVISAVSGYAGGTIENPTYQDYGAAGHREVVLVTYDPSIVSYANLIEHIIKHGDPTDAEGSFYDRGAEYAPAVYYENATEEKDAHAVIAAADAFKVFEKPIALAVLPRVPFWPAEEYHQDYYKKNSLKYLYYRNASGRDAFVKKHWGEKAGEFTLSASPSSAGAETSSKWSVFKKPAEALLRAKLTPLQYAVTQEGATERPFANEYDKNMAEGIYVDIVSGEPLYSSLDKYDSGTGWPSFVKPISSDAVTLKVDNGFFRTRTEVRSHYADSHLGHVFNDGPAERGGRRYCMNSAALRFVPKAELQTKGYGEYLALFQ